MINFKFKKSKLNKEEKVKDIVIGGGKEAVQTSPGNVWLFIFVATISLVCSYMGFSDGFKIGSSLLFVFPTFAAVSIGAWLVMSKPSIMVKGFIGIAGIIAIYHIATIKWIVNGYTIIINRIIGYINENKAEAHLKYVVSNKTAGLDVALATVGLCLIYGLVFNILFKFKRIFMCAILMLVFAMSNMYFNGQDQEWWVAATLMCVVAVFYISNIKVFKHKKNLYFGAGIVGVIALISVAFVLIVNYTSIRSVDDLKDEIVYRAGNVIYGKSDYPEGQFKRFHEVPAKGGETRLSIGMSNGIPMHLKGYVGCQYTEKGWDGNEEKIYGGANKGMIEWFLKQEYYPLTQVGYYLGYSRNDGRNIKFKQVKNSSIHIKNKSASTKYEYVTENLVDMSGLIDPKQDVNFVATTLKGEKEYWYDVLFYTEDNYIKFPAQEWYENDGDGSSDQERFVKAENYYHGFASKYYLKVPKKEKAILSSNIPACSNNVKDAITTVRHYLKDQIAYSKKVAEYDPDKNYLEQVLLKDKKGFSPQYATVATLMFRYYGVPARYVEGYWSPNEKEAKKVKLKAEDAHAWVEVYIKGIGFVPVEVTPGFYQEDESGGVSNQATPPKKKQKGGGGTTGTQGDQAGDVIIVTWWMIVLALLALVVLVAIIMAIVLVIRRWIVLAKHKKLLADEDDYVAVAEAGRHMDKICRFNKVKVTETVSEDIKEILERIKFSKHPLKIGEKDKVCAYMQEMLKTTWEKQKFVNKLKMMFIHDLK